jgi:hypothetical protein
VDRQTCAHCHQSYCSACIDDDTGYCYTCESLTNVGRKDVRLKPLLQELSFITRLSATSFEISENHRYRVIRYKMWHKTYVHVISLSTGKSIYHGQLKK